jgi:hypothetical protein
VETGVAVKTVHLHPRTGQVQSVTTTRVLGFWKQCRVMLVLYRTRDGRWHNAFDRNGEYFIEDH